MPSPFSLLYAGLCWNCGGTITPHLGCDVYDCEPCGLEFLGVELALVRGQKDLVQFWTEEVPHA